MEIDSEYIYSNGRQIFKGDVIYQIDPRLKMSLFEKPLEHSFSTYKEKLADIVQPQKELTADDIDLAIKYLSTRDVNELVTLFGFNKSENELDNTYSFIQNITAMNEKKPIEQNSTFSILLESYYSDKKSYTLYLSKDQVLNFSDLQKEIELESGNKFH